MGHANTADTATNAQNATNATNATNAQTAANAEALSGNTIVREGNLDGQGTVANSSCASVDTDLPGAHLGDHVLLTAPPDWPTY